jgi:hypothetical protein
VIPFGVSSVPLRPIYHMSGKLKYDKPWQENNMTPYHDKNRIVL